MVAKRLDSRYRPGIRSRSWIKTKHFQTKTFALLGWLPPHEWRGDRGCVALGLETGDGISFAGVVESGHTRELVDQLSEMTRAELRILGEPGVRWDGDEPATAEIKYLEWVPGMGCDMRSCSVGLSALRRSGCDLARVFRLRSLRSTPRCLAARQCLEVGVSPLRLATLVTVPS